jgi:hypothetical protein
VAGFALLFGIAGGVALNALVTNLISLTATGSEPVPPLVTITPWAQAIGLLAVLALALTLAIVLQTRRAFRAPAVGRLNA